MKESRMRVASYQTARLLQILVGMMLVASAWPKIREPFSYLRIVIGYQIPLARLPELIATYLPWLEIICGTCFLIGVFRLGASFLCCAFFWVGSLILASILLRGVVADCGCFGVDGGSLVTVSTLLRALAAAIAMSWVLKTELHRARGGLLAAASEAGPISVRTS